MLPGRHLRVDRGGAAPGNVGRLASAAGAGAQAPRARGGLPGRLPADAGEDARAPVVRQGRGSHDARGLGRRRLFTGAGGLWSAPRDGTTPSTLLTTGFVLSLFVDGTSVTYTSSKTLQRISRAGGPPTVLVTEHEDLIDLTGDGNSLFYSMFDGTPIRRLPYGGGTSTPVHPGIKSGALAVDETHLYVASYALGTVTRVAKTGGSPAPISSATPRPVGIVVDDHFVFVTCEADGSVRRIPKSGGAVAILARGQVNHDQPAQDDTYVYWTSGGQDMAVMRVPKDGSRPAEVVYAPLHTNPNQVAVDETNVYVTETGGVLVLPKAK